MMQMILVSFHKEDRMSAGFLEASCMCQGTRESFGCNAVWFRLMSQVRKLCSDLLSAIL
jgi:hypothetical protein